MVEVTAKALFIAAVCVFLWVGLFNIRQPLLEMHSFRQTQTALSAYWMLAEGFSLPYQTPVLGAPWSVPFEFPIYQMLVAGIAKLTGADLDPVGRVVGVVAGLAVCLPLFRTLRVLGASAGAAHYANALYLTVPVYLFWSGTFMIEGLALLLMVSAGYYMVKLYQGGVQLRDLLLFGSLLTLALLQKVTTAGFPAIIGLAVFGWRAVRTLRLTRDLRSADVRGALQVLVVASVALLIGYAWVKYTDDVKMGNEFARFLTSSALGFWNYGPLELRFGRTFLVDVLVMRILVPSSAWGLGLLAVLALYLGRPHAVERRIALLGLTLFLVPMLVLTNLHVVHDYYQVANLVFLLAVIAVAVAALSARLGPRFPGLGPGLMVALVLANLFFSYTIYYPIKTKSITEANSRTLKVAAFIRSQTPAERPILVFGFDWSSELPYYARRKALAVPPWTKLEMVAAQTPQRYLPTTPGAVVSCSQPNAEAIRAAITTNFPNSRMVAVDDCNVYLPAP